jgi:hypothetical protein
VGRGTGQRGDDQVGRVGSDGVLGLGYPLQIVWLESRS